MSIGELISDEPCEPEPFIDYLIEHYRGYLAETWGGGTRDEEPCKIGSVTINLSHFIMRLENLKRKMHRPEAPTREEYKRRLDRMVQRSVDAWQALGYPPSSTCGGLTLAEAITKRLQEEKG